MKFLIASLKAGKNTWIRVVIVHNSALFDRYLGTELSPNFLLMFFNRESRHDLPGYGTGIGFKTNGFLEHSYRHSARISLLSALLSQLNESLRVVHLH